jgi:hypothetical protein
MERLAEDVGLDRTASAEIVEHVQRYVRDIAAA